MEQGLDRIRDVGGGEIVDHGRADEPGMEREHRHSMCLDVRSQALRPLRQCCFRGAVRIHLWESTEPGAGGDVDDPSSLALDHSWQYGPGVQEGPAHVDLERTPPVFEINLPIVAEGTHGTGIVD